MSAGDSLDFTGLTPEQVEQVRTVIRAARAGLITGDELHALIAAGTPAEVAEEAGRRLAAARAS